jgi:hypothetical protein
MSHAARLLAGFLLVLAACGGDQATSRAGNLRVSLFAGQADAGALLLTISGGPVEAVTAVGGQQVSFSSPAAGTTNVVVVGTLQTGDLLTIRVPDTSRAADYRAQVDQAADNVSFALLNPSSYTLTIAR